MIPYSMLIAFPFCNVSNEDVFFENNYLGDDNSRYDCTYYVLIWFILLGGLLCSKIQSGANDFICRTYYFMH